MEGRLHKSVSREIPTLYLLSDKEPLMGDELGAAGGSDRLWGNNKAISGCQRSPRDGTGTGTETCQQDRNQSSNVSTCCLGPNQTVVPQKGRSGWSWGGEATERSGSIWKQNFPFLLQHLNVLVLKSSECWDPRPLLVQFPASAKGHEGRGS